MRLHKFKNFAIRETEKDYTIYVPLPDVAGNTYLSFVGSCDKGMGETSLAAFVAAVLKELSK